MALFILQPDAEGNCCECDGRTEPCNSCGEPAVCDCFYKISTASSSSESPIFFQQVAIASPCPNVSVATDLLASNATCFVSFSRGGTSLTPLVSKSSSYDNNILNISESVGITPRQDTIANQIIFLANVAVGSKITVNYNCVSAGNNAYISSIVLQVAGPCATSPVIDRVQLTPIDFGYSSTQNGTITMTTPFLEEGEYLILLQSAALPMSIGDNVSNLTSTFNVTTTSGPFLPSPIVALYDDSGTTRQLEACPKMVIPSPTNSSSWYTTEAFAQEAINENVLDCKIAVFSNIAMDCQGVPDPSGIDGDFSGTATSVISNSVLVSSSAIDATYGCFFISYIEILGTPGATVSVESIYSGQVLNLNACYTVQLATDNEGGFFQSGTGTSLIDSVIPANGRALFIFKIAAYARFEPASSYTPFSIRVDFTISSSVSFEQLDIQALYDVDLDCPARLNC